MIEIEIDGKPLTVPEGTTIIEAADAAGIYIPRFCYHKKLSIAANCRMCLVEVEKSGKPLPACATPITPSMKVKTTSPMALKAQRDVMEFLLINHPLDCPICDQGGECELQDLSMGYGSSKSQYEFPKRAVCSEDIGPLIETEMTRCIQCTRCVRFGEEIAGLRELGVVNRGEKEEIGTYVQHFLKSEISGNIIDICPVGALTNKPARYLARGWELKEHASISPHDCVGTNVFLHSRGHEYSPERTIFRSVPRENEVINETWMSDRDRFAVEGLYHADRIYKPLMKKNNQWVEVEWMYALNAIVHLTQKILTLDDADIAGIADYSATLEEYYLFQKLIRSLGSSNVDHRIRESDFRDQETRPLFPRLNTPIAEIENCDVILLVGSNVRFEQPIIAARMFKASQDGLSVMAVNPVDYSFVFPVSDKMINENIIQSLTDIVAALQSDTNTAAGKIAAHLKNAKKAAIFVGAYAQHHASAATIRDLVHRIAQLTHATPGLLTDGANSAGAWLAGCIPHRMSGGVPTKQQGKNAKALLTEKAASAYFLLNTEVEFDSAYPQKALDNLSQSKLVVCFNTFATEKMREYADFILPITPYSENEGTYVNVEGTWQSFEAVGPAHGQAKPAWKAIRALATLLALPEFSYTSVNEIRDEVKSTLNQSQDLPSSHTSAIPAEIVSHEPVPTWSIYRDNALVRRSAALQATGVESC